MFYRIRVDLAYPEETNPKEILAHAKSLMSKAVVINPGLHQEESGHLILEKCYHDDVPTKPCEIIIEHHA